MAATATADRTATPPAFIDENTPVVCDNGTGMVKVGFCGEDMPRHVFPSMIGRPRHAMIMHGKWGC